MEQCWLTDYAENEYCWWFVMSFSTCVDKSSITCAARKLRLQSVRFCKNNHQWTILLESKLHLPWLGNEYDYDSSVASLHDADSTTTSSGCFWIWLLFFSWYTFHHFILPLPNFHAIFLHSFYTVTSRISNIIMDILYFFNNTR